MSKDQLPRFQSHKIVQAMKIRDIRHTAATTFLVGEDPTDPGAELMEVEVSQDYANKHRPAVGGYYVLYPDGYESWSPAQAFENGYMRLATDE